MYKTKIMVVENEGIVAHDIARQLTDMGYNVVAIAYSGGGLSIKDHRRFAALQCKSCPGSNEKAGYLESLPIIRTIANSQKIHVLSRTKLPLQPFNNQLPSIRVSLILTPFAQSAVSSFKRTDAP